jgi:hydroxysqualene synthase
MSCGHPGIAAPQSRPVSVDHYENFPVASVLCPPRLRAPVRAIYAFARTADDLADEGDAPAAQRLDQLAAYRRALDAAASGTPPIGPWAGVFRPLQCALDAHALPLPLLHALLDAFEQDVRNPGYADRQALLDYCRRSADPIGRLLLHLYGIDDPSSLRQSDAICTALQLINFWQDLSVDLPRGRHYVPASDAARHGVTLAALETRQDSAAARALVRELCAWAQALMHEGAPLVHRIPGRAGWELRWVAQGGLRILEKIARMEHATLRQRPTLNAADAGPIAWRVMHMRPSRGALESAA